MPPAATAPSEAARKAWNDWFDTRKTSIAMALRGFRIVTDTNVDDLDKEDEIVPDVPFVLRPKQAKCLELCEKFFWKLKDRAARIVCLKSRRYGMTTFFLLFGLERVLRIPGYQVLLVAQDDEMARYHFQRLRDSFKQVPAWALKERGIEIVKDDNQHLILRHGNHKTSSFTVAPAKRKALGRGAQYNMLILTDFPAWPKSVKANLSGLLRSCRNVRGNVIAFESTAHGYEEFHRRYKLAAKRQSDYRAMFIASFEHPSNRKPFETPEEETAFIETIGKLKEYGQEDELVLFRKLTVDKRWSFSDAAQFLNWRRSTLVDDCEGSIDNLHREEPNTPDEAFSGTGIPIFKKEVLEAWRPAAEARETAAEKGRLMIRGHEIQFASELRVELVVLERPIIGHRYGLGSDVASGVARLADGKSEADFSYTCVKDAETKRTVARLRVHMPPTEFSEATFRLACWYNASFDPFRCVLIERAINESGVCIDRFEDLEFEKFVGSEMLLGQRVLIKTDAANMRANYKWTPGFKTTGKSKPKLIDNIRREVIDHGMPEVDKPCPYDVQFINEAMCFERDDRTGKMEAATGHDDGVIAEGLALEACERIMEDVHEDAPPPPPKGSHAVLLKYAAMAAAQSENDDKENDVPGLPGY